MHKTSGWLERVRVYPNAAQIERIAGKRHSVVFRYGAPANYFFESEERYNIMQNKTVQFCRTRCVFIDQLCDRHGLFLGFRCQCRTQLVIWTSATRGHFLTLVRRHAVQNVIQLSPVFCFLAKFEHWLFDPDKIRFLQDIIVSKILKPVSKIRLQDITVCKILESAFKICK